MTDNLTALKAEVEVGWQVKIIDHDYIKDSRDEVSVAEVHDDRLVLRPKRPWTSQGRTFETEVFTWDKEGEGVTGRFDQEVSGRTVRLYRTPPPHTGKERRLIKTFVFSPPHDR